MPNQTLNVGGLGWRGGGVRLCFGDFIVCCVCLWGESGGVGGARRDECCGELSEESGYLWRSGCVREY